MTSHVKMACRWYEVCPLRQWEKEGLIDESWKEAYCLSEKEWRTCRRFQLEEQGIPHDDILPDGKKRPDR